MQSIVEHFTVLSQPTCIQVNLRTGIDHLPQKVDVWLLGGSIRISKTQPLPSKKRMVCQGGCDIYMNSRNEKSRGVNIARGVDKPCGIAEIFFLQLDD